MIFYLSLSLSLSLPVALFLGCDSRESFITRVPRVWNEINFECERIRVATCYVDGYVRTGTASGIRELLLREISMLSWWKIGFIHVQFKPAYQRRPLSRVLLREKAEQSLKIK